MGNEKGYTFLEVVLTLAISSIIVFNVFYIPTDLIKSNIDYSGFSSETSDVATLRKVISRDLRSGDVEVHGSNLKIGNKEYNFGEQVSRDSLLLTEQPYDFKYESGVLEIHNENLKFKYNTKSSFNRDGDGNG